MTTATYTGRTSKQVHKSADRVLTEAQLHQINGGTIPETRLTCNDRISRMIKENFQF
jgi:hypothetical protein